LRHLLKLDRVGLFIDYERRLTPEQTSAYFALIRRRINHEPTAYIIGHKEFFGLDFHVSPSVLIPRPETELLIETAIELISSRFPQSCLIADIGTGCGAVAIALAVHLPHARIYATDISTAALEIAEANCQQHGVSDRVTFLHGSLVDPLPAPVDVIVANLPYVAEPEFADLTPEIIRFEPKPALAGGTDGLEMIKELLSQLKNKLLSGGAVILEIGHNHGQAVHELAKKRFPESEVSIITDLSGLDRVVSILMGR